MKRKIAIVLIVLLVFSPYSLNFGSLKSIDSTEVNAKESLLDGEELTLNEEIFASEVGYEYYSEEVQLIEKLDEQIAQIEENLETLQNQDIEQELAEVVEEIQSIDIQQVIAEEIKQQSEELTLGNTEVIIESLENENFSIEEFTDDVIDETTETEEAVVNTIDSALENETTEENIDEEIIEDPIATAIENGDTDELTPKNVLLDSDISLNIVITEGEETTVKELGEFVEEVATQSKGEQYSMINKNTASAASASWGYFLASQRSAIANMNTKVAKYVNIGTITVAGGVLKPKSYTIKLENKRKTSSSGSYSSYATKSISNAKLGTSYYLESSISKSYFWKAYASFTGTFKDGSKDTDNTSTDRVLINKKGVPYPTYKDSKSGKKMSEPSSTTWKKGYYPEAWTTSKRNKYLDWYESKYGKITRTDYEIHHIRPRVYYGSNDYSNLIPLKKTYHKKTVSPWWTNY
ncbi:hypothetical protein [Lederbergia lenta]|uniref:hypothetical protein n=1 Tax=Lederbergia lenta TaxID=1467 RepID=UPI002041B246|nr:hypothetical protein [Lederbergia lenta]MCM3112032.1 hypothetical protein [Lederbergia lenta]